MTPKPAALDWDQAGALFVARTTAYACVRAVNSQPGDTVAVSGDGYVDLAIKLGVSPRPDQRTWIAATCPNSESSGCDT